MAIRSSKPRRLKREEKLKESKHVTERLYPYEGEIEIPQEKTMNASSNIDIWTHGPRGAGRSIAAGARFVLCLMAILLPFLGSIEAGAQVDAGGLQGVADLLNPGSCASLSDGGSKMVCQLKHRLERALNGPDFHYFLNQLFAIFWIIIAYQVIKMMSTKPITDWPRDLFELMLRIAICMLIAFPHKYGFGAGSQSPVQQVYKWLEQVGLGVVQQAANYTTKDSGVSNQGMATIIGGYLEIGNMFAAGSGVMKQKDGSNVECDSLIDSPERLFQPMPSGFFSVTQADCIVQIMGHAVAVGGEAGRAVMSVDKGGLYHLWYTQNGFGGFSREQIITALNSPDERVFLGSRQLTSPMKFALKDWLYKEADIRRLMPLAIAATSGGSVSGEGDELKIETAFLGAGLARISGQLHFYVSRIFGSFFSAPVDSTFWFEIILMWILKAVIYGGVVAIGAAFFLMVMGPVLVLPVALAVYQTMFITGVLDGGRLKKLIKTGLDTFAPFALWPAVFVFLSLFIVAIMKGLPAAMLAVDYQLPLPWALAISIVFTLLVSVYSFKILSKAREWAKDFLQGQFDSALRFALDFAGFWKAAAFSVLAVAAAPVVGVLAAKLGGMAGGSSLLKAGGATSSVGAKASAVGGAGGALATSGKVGAVAAGALRAGGAGLKIAGQVSQSTGRASRFIGGGFKRRELFQGVTPDRGPTPTAAVPRSMPDPGSGDGPKGATAAADRAAANSIRQREESRRGASPFAAQSNQDLEQVQERLVQTDKGVAAVIKKLEARRSSAQQQLSEPNVSESTRYRAQKTIEATDLKLKAAKGYRKNLLGEQDSAGAEIVSRRTAEGAAATHRLRADATEALEKKVVADGVYEGVLKALREYGLDALGGGTPPPSSGGPGGGTPPPSSGGPGGGDRGTGDGSDGLVNSIKLDIIPGLRGAGRVIGGLLRNSSAVTAAVEGVKRAGEAVKKRVEQHVPGGKLAMAAGSAVGTGLKKGAVGVAKGVVGTANLAADATRSVAADVASLRRESPLAKVAGDLTGSVGKYLKGEVREGLGTASGGALEGAIQATDVIKNALKKEWAKAGSQESKAARSSDEEQQRKEGHNNRNEETIETISEQTEDARKKTEDQGASDPKKDAKSERSETRPEKREKDNKGHDNRIGSLVSRSIDAVRRAAQAMALKIRKSDRPEPAAESRAEPQFNPEEEEEEEG